VSALKTLEFLPPDRFVRLGVKYSFQDWMVHDWNDAHGDAVEELLRVFNAPSRIVLRANTLKGSRDRCIDRLLGEGVATVPTTISPDGLVAEKRFQAQSLRTFKEGFVEVQDEGSQIATLLSCAKPGDVVIDACAGAGGKSLHFASLMNNVGEIIAVDVDGNRLEELRRRALRAGAGIVKAIPKQDFVDEQYRSYADIVFIDAPCTGSGTIRRSPDLKWTISEQLVDHYIELGERLLADYSRCLKPGGVLIYVTCSLFRRENSEPVRRFVARNPQFVIAQPPGLSMLGGVPNASAYIELLPHVHQTDGFTIQALRHEKEQ